MADLYRFASESPFLFAFCFYVLIEGIRKTVNDIIVRLREMEREVTEQKGKTNDI